MEKNKITLEWHSIIKDIVRNIWVVILSALIGVMGFYLVTHGTYNPEYTSAATIAVISGGSKSSSFSALTMSNEKANVLVNIFTQPAMKECAARHLGDESFDGSISAEVLGATNLIEIKVTSSHPQKAYELLNSVIYNHHEVSGKVFKNANTAVVRMPSVPSGPSNRISNENRSIVVAACITLSLGLIFMLSVMRNTVKKEEDFNEKIDSKLIGTIAHEDKKMTLQEIRQKKKKGLLIHSNAYISLRFTENFHKIAAKLEYMKMHGGDSTFAITSVTENEGKSTCAANLAVSLADRGNKVVLVDLDGKKPALYKIFNEEFKEESELSFLLNGEISGKDYRLRRFKKSSLFLAINTKPSSDYQSWVHDGSIIKVLEKLKKEFDFVIIDTAPLSLDSTVTDIIQLTDKTIMIVRTDTVSVNVLNDQISTISKISGNLAGCILNDVHLNILPFSFTGNDESNYGGYKYGKYSHYGHYGSYGKHHGKSSSRETAEQ